MKFTISATTILAALITVAISKPLDVFNPTIITPNAGTVWKVGQVETVTWYAALVYTEKVADDSRVLMAGKPPTLLLTSAMGHPSHSRTRTSPSVVSYFQSPWVSSDLLLNVAVTLASGFDLRSGSQVVTVPANTPPGHNFHITRMFLPRTSKWSSYWPSPP